MSVDHGLSSETDCSLRAETDRVCALKPITVTEMKLIRVSALNPNVVSAVKLIAVSELKLIRVSALKRSCAAVNGLMSFLYCHDDQLD